MESLKTINPSPPMQIHKPYKPKPAPPASSPSQDSVNKPADEEQTSTGKLNRPQPLPPNMQVSATPPFTVPPFYLYQMMGPTGPMGLPKPVPTPFPPGEVPPLLAPFPLQYPGIPPIPGIMTPIPLPKQTKPRIVHEYFDTLVMQWKEFNPEGNVVGDETDPFIVYFRYGNKSIGARRTPWILPKHIKLVKIMQDCLPDFDWRNGEDLLIKARVLYLRRKALEDAVESLKRGEIIGPLSQSIIEAENEELKAANATASEKTSLEQAKSTKTTTTHSSNQRTDMDLQSPESPSSIVTQVPVTESRDVPTSQTILPRLVESEDSSDAHSTSSDFPPTPVSTESITSIPETEASNLVDENLRELEQLKTTGTGLGSQDLVPSLDTAKQKSGEPEVEKLELDNTSSQKTIKASEATETLTETALVVSTDKKEKGTVRGWEMLQMVLSWICNEFAADEEALARQLANNEISFRFLWLYYVPGTLVSLEDPISKQQMAARVEVSEYSSANTATQVPSRLNMQMKTIDGNGDDFIYSTMVAHINEYDGAKLISELAIQILTADLPLYKTLKERGKKFIELNGVHYMTLDGILIVNRGRDVLRVRSKTRVMIDCKAFREANPSYNHSFTGISLTDLLVNSGSRHHPRYGVPGIDPLTGTPPIPGGIAANLQPKDIKHVPEEELVLCAPTVFGYAFTEKAWVQMTVEGISPIVWDVDAYNKLVLPEDTKKLVKSLVQACRTDSKLITDIISSKGSGVVFVLHGEPGTGKTLTAEAIGEELRRPILVIAVSDLGTDPSNVEIRLGTFLRTAEKWDSIVLLDEADIFLEHRGRHDIFRNAMVGVFLRLLEYHNSPMFLTTNRVFAFDPAIRSRISIAIKYHPLKREARKQVWQQLLDMASASISPEDLDEVSRSQVNGREIKNTIRSAQALAVADGTELSMKHIQTVLQVQKDFKEDFEGFPGIWNGMGLS